MYSIFIKSNSGDRFTYYLNSDGEIYTTDDLTILGEKIGDLLKTYTLDKIVPVKNCIITKNIVVEEVQ